MLCFLFSNLFVCLDFEFEGTLLDDLEDPHDGERNLSIFSDLVSRSGPLHFITIIISYSSLLHQARPLGTC